jgi:hypothetical protein
MNRAIWIALLVTMASACAETKTSSGTIVTETGSDTGTGPGIGTETASETASDTGDGEQETTPPPGTLGEACWNKDKLPSGHPNWGMPDCADEFTCMGNQDEAWCTEKCTATGSISTDPAIEGWCCGEVTGACNPSRYWLPPSMVTTQCASREIPLGEPCSLASGADQCKPICSGTEELFRVTCAATSLESGFCTHSCETHADCLDDEPFANGCCGEIMGSTNCLPEITDACLPIANASIDPS